MQPKFNLGDTVYMGDYERHEKYIACPDCLGIKHLKVILGDGTEVTIECGGCYPGGYEPSTGRIKQYDYEVVVKKRTVTGLQISASNTDYHLDGTDCHHYSGTDENVFSSEGEALVYANSRKSEYEDEENKRLLAKTKDHRSWSWNAHYHRAAISRLEQELEYHRNKVSICA